MKKSASILAKFTLGLVIAGSVFACKQTPADTKTAVPVDAKATIVYINQDTLLSKYEYVKDMTKRLTEKNNNAQSDVQSKEQAFQREVADYQKSAPTMAADARAATEQKLQGKGQELQQYKQNAGAEVQQVQQSEQLKLYEKLSDFSKTYAKEKGYKLILTYVRGNTTILYGDPSMDVTADVVKRLNEAYAKDKK